MLRIKAISTPRFGDPIRPSLPNQPLHRRPWKAIVHFSQPVLKPLFCVLSFVACANVLAGQATRPDSIQSQPGFHVELLHSATAEQGSWISMTFDDQGRLILGIDKQGLTRITFDGQDQLSFERINDSLKHCRGVLWAHNSLYVAATYSNGYYRLQDTNGDDQFDDVQLLCKMDYRSRYGHGTNQVVLGPDGMIYIANGNDVSFPPQVSQNSPYRNPQNDWLLPNPHDLGEDHRVGHILRTDADGQHWEVIAGGFRNQFDLVFNENGELFTYDSDMEWDVGLPWYRPTRLNHVVSAGEYGWRWGTGKWPSYFADSLPTTLDTGLGSPTGMIFATASRFPAKFRSALLMADWQNGRILAVYLTPRGASYTAEYEVFLEGAPLNVCDMVFGKDGSLYFITGGRGSQSGLYRVSYVGDEWKPDIGKSQPSVANAKATQARQLRHELEHFHTTSDPAAVDFVWPHLGSQDRWIQFAARVALERQNVEWWQEKALQETKVTIQLNALLALVRSPAENPQVAILKALDRLALDELNDGSLLIALRLYAISFIRHGSPDTATQANLAVRMNKVFPREDVRINQELGELLVYLNAPNVISTLLDRMEAAPTQQEQIHHGMSLRHAQDGWTAEQQQRMLNWIQHALNFYGGKLVNATIDAIRDDFLNTLDEEQREPWQEILARQPAIDEQHLISPKNLPHVRDWKWDDLLPALDQLEESERSLSRGRLAVTKTHCFRCHRIGHEGAHVGPDLTNLGRRYDARKIWESIVAPSQTIDPKYRQTTYFLDSGKIVTGRALHVNGKELTVETNPLTTAQSTIERTTIESSRPSPISVMPSGLVNVLEKEEILDLIAYLISSSGEKNRALAE